MERRSSTVLVIVLCTLQLAAGAPSRPEVEVLPRARVQASGGADDRDVAVVTTALERLDPSVTLRLALHGVRVVVCRGSVAACLVEAPPSPRGWGPGARWSDVSGLYHPRRDEIVVATVERDGERLLPSRGARHGSVDVLRHEVFHALDAHEGRSLDPAFVAARKADRANLSPYEANPTRAGCEETFAETAARFDGGDASLPRERPALHRWFDRQRR